MLPAFSGDYIPKTKMLMRFFEDIVAGDIPVYGDDVEDVVAKPKKEWWDYGRVFDTGLS